MLLSAVRDEFAFHCECRKLSPRTVKNYTKQIDYLLRFLETEKSVAHSKITYSSQTEAEAKIRLLLCCLFSLVE